MKVWPPGKEFSKCFKHSSVPFLASSLKLILHFWLNVLHYLIRVEKCIGFHSVKKTGPIHLKVISVAKVLNDPVTILSRSNSQTCYLYSLAVDNHSWFSLDWLLDPDEPFIFLMKLTSSIYFLCLSIRNMKWIIALSLDL